MANSGSNSRLAIGIVGIILGLLVLFGGASTLYKNWQHDDQRLAFNACAAKIEGTVLGSFGMYESDSDYYGERGRWTVVSSYLLKSGAETVDFTCSAVKENGEYQVTDWHVNK